jgi:putative mRNA 3-end processing factor
MMCILEQHNIPKKYQIYLDGMARKVNDILMDHPEYIASPQSFNRAVSRTKIIQDNKDRTRAIRDGGIIISPAGMLKGGASHMYFKALHGDPKNSIILVSFQVPGTPGAELLAKQKVTVGNRIFNVAADVRQFHLSSHTDWRGMMNMLMSIPTEPEFYCVHGESESCDAMAEKLEKRGRQAHVPEINERLVI